MGEGERDGEEGMTNDELEYTCKFILEPDECWKYFKMRKCPYLTIQEKQVCKEYKKKMVW